MYTRLSLTSDFAMSADEYNGMKLLMKYGDGDYQKAYEAVMEEIEIQLRASNEGFFDIVKEAATWIWNKIKELWDMFVAWIKKLFGKTEKRDGRPEFSVFSYGKFPAGYRPSEFEHGDCKLPGWTGSMDCCYMRSTRVMDLFIARTEGICKELTNGNIASFFKKNVDNFTNPNYGDRPLDDFQNIIRNSEKLFEGIVSFTIDTYLRNEMREQNIKTGTCTNINNIRRDEFSGIDIAHCIDRAKGFILFNRDPKLYAEMDPYASNSGWDAGTVYRDYISDNGHMSYIKKLLSDTTEKFNKDVVQNMNAKMKAYRWNIAGYDDPKNGSAYGDVHSVLNAHLQTAEFQVAERYANLVSLCEMFKSILDHLSREIMQAEARMLFNARAISNDVNYQKDHTGNLGTK